MTVEEARRRWSETAGIEGWWQSLAVALEKAMADEREACARVAETSTGEGHLMLTLEGRAQGIARMIRARAMKDLIDAIVG